MTKACCVSCGRECRHSLCAKCAIFGNSRRSFDKKPSRNIKVVNETPIEEHYDDDRNPSNMSLYHGESVRDDI